MNLTSTIRAFIEAAKEDAQAMGNALAEAASQDVQGTGDAVGAASEQDPDSTGAALVAAFLRLAGSTSDAVKSGAFLCGPPERIIEQLKTVEENYPALERIGVSHPVGTPQAVILEQMEWFAKEVMPAFSGRVEAAVPAD